MDNICLCKHHRARHHPYLAHCREKGCKCKAYREKPKKAVRVVLPA